MQSFSPSTLDLVLVAIPVIVTAAAIVLGVRQVRFLRELTGDNSIVTSILGLTMTPPPPPKEGFLYRQKRRTPLLGGFHREPEPERRAAERRHPQAARS